MMHFVADEEYRLPVLQDDLDAALSPSAACGYKRGVERLLSKLHISQAD